MNKKIIFIYFIYYVLLIFATIISIKYKYPNTMIAPIAAVSCLILPILFKCFKLKITFNMYLLNILFVFISNVWGSMLDGYSIAYFDKILHFSSGILLTNLSFMIYILLISKINLNKNEIYLCILFIHSLNMMIAELWEFIEFGGLIFLNNDAIHHYSSGVYDSMQDMLVAYIGGIIVSIFIYFDFKNKKKSIFYKEMMKLLDINRIKLK